MKSKSKKRIDIVKWRKQVQFVDNWSCNPQPIQYDPLVDRHNLYYFQLPSIQKHLRKLKKKAKKQLNTPQNQAFIHGLQKNRIIFGSGKNKRSLSQKTLSEYEGKSLINNRLQSQSNQSLSGKKIKTQNSQSLSKKSLYTKLPSLMNSRQISPKKQISNREASIEKYNIIEQIIRRRLGTDFQ